MVSLLTTSPLLTASLQSAADQALQLKDIHLPDSPGFWPLAPGWWILLALCLFFIIWLLLKLKQKAKQRKHRQRIFSQYKALEEKLLDKPDNENIAAINTFLRQLAVNKYPRSDIASLTGTKWLAFLDQSGNTTKFSKGVGQILIEAPYQVKRPQDFKVADFTQLIRKWIKKTSNNKAEKNVKLGGGVNGYC